MEKQAQEIADRVRIVREELAKPELSSALALTPEQLSRLDEWSRAKLSELAGRFDVDTTDSQKRFSWGMRIASTLGGLALCAAVVLFFARYWGYLETWVQILVVMFVPLAALAGTEYAARRERTLYFAGLLALVSLTGFVMNLVVIGRIFNIASTEKALLAWSAFALFLAYRYGLRMLLAIGLLLLLSYGAALWTARLGYSYLTFYHRPEQVALLALALFAVPFFVEHDVQSGFPAVYRQVSAVVFLLCILSLAEWGSASDLPFDTKTIERCYEATGLCASAGLIWFGIKRGWNYVVNAGSVFFVIFLFCRLYHWWWDWLPKYLFFAVIGALGILLVMAFKRMRSRLVAVRA